MTSMEAIEGIVERKSRHLRRVTCVERNPFAKRKKSKEIIWRLVFGDEIKMKTNPKMIPETDRLFFQLGRRRDIDCWWRACAGPNVLPKRKKEKHGIRQTDRNKQQKWLPAAAKTRCSPAAARVSPILANFSFLLLLRGHVCVFIEPQFGSLFCLFAFGSTRGRSSRCTGGHSHKMENMGRP